MVTGTPLACWLGRARGIHCWVAVFRLFAWIDLGSEGRISFAQFCNAMEHNSFFRMVVTEGLGGSAASSFTVSQQYDYTVGESVPL